MNEEEIRALEPKYIGNTRHLTPGEAGEIVHDPNNRITADEGLVAQEVLITSLVANNLDGDTSMRV